MTTTWFALCNQYGFARICNSCARNPENQKEAATDDNQHWSTPLIRSDNRCGDWMARREVVK